MVYALLAPALPYFSFKTLNAFAEVILLNCGAAIAPQGFKAQCLWS
mgnify:CR=1 FL=1